VNASEYIASIPWAIQPEWLGVMMQIAAGQNDSIEAVEARLGKKLDNTRTVTVREGVAIIPVTGPIFRRANLFTRLSGATSVQQLGLDIQAAVDDPNVKSILLNIDSPGGEANGINELANQIAEAATKKPLLSYVGGLGASGAYWLASAGDEIVIDDGAILGSIGVVMSGVDNRGAYEQRGVKVHTYTSSNAPKKRPQLGTESGDAEIQKTIDALEDVFIQAVARNRAVTVEKVLTDFGQGGLLVGKAAVESGLADRLGSFEALITEMSAGMRRKRKKMSATAEANNLPAKGPTGGTKMNLITEFKKLIAKAEAEPEAGADAGEEKQEAGKPAQLRAATASEPAPPVSGESARIEALEKELREMKIAGHQTKAEAFANGLIKGSKLLPAQKPALVKSLVAALQSDEKEGLTGEASQYTLLTEGTKARVIADTDDPEADALAEIEASTKAYAERANGKRPSAS
jgi:signal peptide peptidase SppA